MTKDRFYASDLDIEKLTLEWRKPVDLLPCPFCGGEAHDSDDIDTYCTKCGATGPIERDKAWNTRTSPWRPISEAPRDGTQILAYTEKGFSIIKWNDKVRVGDASATIQAAGWIAICENDEIEDNGWDTGANFALKVDNPTHFIPLPAPPVSKED